MDLQPAKRGTHFEYREAQTEAYVPEQKAYCGCTRHQATSDHLHAGILFFIIIILYYPSATTTFYLSLFFLLIHLSLIFISLHNQHNTHPPLSIITAWVSEGTWFLILTVD